MGHSQHDPSRRRSLVALWTAAFSAALGSRSALAQFTTDDRIGILKANGQNAGNDSAQARKLFDDTAAKVVPATGFQSNIRLGASVAKLAEIGIIDKAKFAAIYRGPNTLPAEIESALLRASDNPILLTPANANNYVNLLWPVGLANYMSTNDTSPIKGKSLLTFASTSGWTLGQESNGGVYFNKVRVVDLTSDQEALATEIARKTYRPCCNNSTFFQDCNHGSALLGVLELGASQGLTKEALYREALAFNSFWFPSNYIQTALYFKAVRNIDWERVDPMEIMGFEYSALGPWSKNVQAEVAKIPGLLPPRNNAACGL